MNIKENIYNYYLKRYVQRASAFPDWSSVKTILLLFESDYTEKNLNIKQLQKELKAEGKQVVAWGFLDKKDIQTAILPEFRIIGKKDVSIIGKPKQTVIDDLRKQHYDVLIDLTSSDLLPLRYISLFAGTRFRTGRSLPRRDGLYDFMVATEQEVDAPFLFDQIIHYLKTIRTND